MTKFEAFPCLGCKVETRPYNPQMKKLNLKTINGFFIGHCIGSRGSRFYCPTYTIRVIEYDKTIFFENEIEHGESSKPRTVEFKDESVVVHISLAPFVEEYVPFSLIMKLLILSMMLKSLNKLLMMSKMKLKTQFHTEG